ncbi:MAG: ATP-binding protein [Rhodocyclaceae bacterium]
MKANIKRPAFDTPLKRPALYNPGLWSAAEVRAYYIARTPMLERLLGDLRREVAGSQPQHRLIVGQRGMGKSTLLRRLAIGVEDDAQLENQWLPLIFPEEQYNVASLADFWLNCLDALGDLQEARGEHALAAAIDAEVERIDRGDSDGALRALLRIAAKLQRRLLLLVDNIDLILERIKTQDWALREVLQGHSELLLIGASSRALEAAYDYGAAFYDFFKIDELRGLSEDEMRETILTLARLRGADDVVKRIESDPGRLPVLHTLTGGNPRTAVLLYGALLKGVDGDVRSDLEALLDEVTPLYKARFDELPTQAQQLLDKLALNWDPITARGLADLLGWQVNLVSAQLDRLAGSGVVEKVKGSGKRIAFQVGERFFNIWYLMRASRRVRRKLMWLVEFMRVFFSADELHKLARQRLSGCVTDAPDAEYSLALSRAIGALPLARALETQALDSLLSGQWRDRIEEMLDLRGEDSHLASKAERIKVRKEARALLAPLFKGKKDEVVLNQLLGLPVPAAMLLETAKIVSAGMQGELKELLRESAESSVKKMTAWLGSAAYPKFGVAIAAGDMEGARDIEGGEAAALRYDYPLLALIPKLLDCREDKARVVELEQLARQALAEDDSGALYYFCLAHALIAQQCNEEALPYARKLCEIEPDNPDNWLIMASLLLGRPDAAAEQLAAARRVLELDPERADGMLMLASSLFVQGKLDEAVQVSRQWLVWLAAQETTGADELDFLIGLVQKTYATGRSKEMLAALDASEVGQRYRPVREALAAVVAGSADFLNGVAPEVRKPAIEVLALIAPQLLKESP